MHTPGACTETPDEMIRRVCNNLGRHYALLMKTVFDLSATPFTLKGSSDGAGKLFPWVVSDFSLIDAIESGIVTVPRVPVAENVLTSDYPKYCPLRADLRKAL